jgi:hypothetical protein
VLNKFQQLNKNYMTNLKIKKITIEKTKKEFSEFASSLISTEDYEKKLSDIATQIDEFAKNKFIVSREKFGKIGQTVGEVVEYYDAKIVLNDFTNQNASIGMTFNADPDLLKTILKSSLNSLNTCIEEQLQILNKQAKNNN